MAAAALPRCAVRLATRLLGVRMIGIHELEALDADRCRLRPSGPDRQGLTGMLEICAWW